MRSSVDCKRDEQLGVMRADEFMDLRDQALGGIGEAEPGCRNLGIGERSDPGEPDMADQPAILDHQLERFRNGLAVHNQRAVGARNEIGLAVAIVAEVRGVIEAVIVRAEEQHDH